jgi:hypothetical protein
MSEPIMMTIADMAALSSLRSQAPLGLRKFRR